MTSVVNSNRFLELEFLSVVIYGLLNNEMKKMYRQILNDVCEYDMVIKWSLTLLLERKTECLPGLSLVILS